VIYYESDVPLINLSFNMSDIYLTGATSPIPGFIVTASNSNGDADVDGGSLGTGITYPATSGIPEELVTLTFDWDLTMLTFFDNDACLYDVGFAMETPSGTIQSVDVSVVSECVAWDNTCNTAYCGDGNLTSGEECDDGNNANSDGCSSTCTIEPFCGDNICSADESCSICSQDCGGCGGGGGGETSLTLSDEAADMTCTNTTISWGTNKSTNSRVVYDLVSHPDAKTIGPANYGYAFTTIESSTQNQTHSVDTADLDQDTTYYFRAVANTYSEKKISNEMTASIAGVTCNPVEPVAPIEPVEPVEFIEPEEPEVIQEVLGVKILPETGNGDKNIMYALMIGLVTLFSGLYIRRSTKIER